MSEARRTPAEPPKQEKYLDMFLSIKKQLLEQRQGPPPLCSLSETNSNILPVRGLPKLPFPIPQLPMQAAREGVQSAHLQFQSPEPLHQPVIPKAPIKIQSERWLPQTNSIFPSHIRFGGQIAPISNQSSQNGFRDLPSQLFHLPIPLPFAPLPDEDDISPTKEPAHSLSHSSANALYEQISASINASNMSKIAGYAGPNPYQLPPETPAFPNLPAKTPQKPSMEAPAKEPNVPLETTREDGSPRHSRMSDSDSSTLTNLFQGVTCMTLLTKGLKHLSIIVNTVVAQAKTMTYRSVSETILARLTNDDSGAAEDYAEEHRARQNVKRRVYDALNVMVSAGVLIRHGKNISVNPKFSHGKITCKKVALAKRSDEIVG